MGIKLGSKVLFLEEIEATVIAFKKEGGAAILIGWKSGKDALCYSWGVGAATSKWIRETCECVSNIEDYCFAYWVRKNALKIIHHDHGNFSKVNQKTLRKRVRDQIAQQILIDK